MPVRIRRPADLSACAAALRRVHEISGYPSAPAATAWPAPWLDPDGTTPTILCCVRP